MSIRWNIPQDGIVLLLVLIGAVALAVGAVRLFDRLERPAAPPAPPSDPPRSVTYSGYMDGPDYRGACINVPDLRASLEDQTARELGKRLILSGLARVETEYDARTDRYWWRVTCRAVPFEKDEKEETNA